MSYGGGTWTAQNKVLPGSYFNFVSAARASAALSDRGLCAIALELGWGPEGEIFTVEAADFRDKSLALLGHSYTDDALLNLRELFHGARIAYLYRLNGDGTKAANAFAVAKYSGERGNDLQIVIEANVNDAGKYDVATYLGTMQVDTQTVGVASDLKENSYVTFVEGMTLEETAGTPLTGGTNGEVTNEKHVSFLQAAESYSFNTLGCAATDSAVKALYTAFTKRLRDESGIKFQTVMHRHASDYEGIISVENNETPDLVFWVTGMQAGCAVNASLTNTAYTGEYTVDVNLTQRQLELGIRAGKFMFHRAYQQARVLTDINTLVTFTDLKGKDFGVNQTIRVIDQVGNDIALLFNTKYLGQVPSDQAGRVSLWGDIVAHHRELEAMRAIEEFNPEEVIVGQGEEKRAVVVSDRVTPTNAMEKLYMTVYVA